MENKLQRTSEIWVDIIGYEGLYQISNNGAVKCLPKSWHIRRGGTATCKEKIKATFLSRGGYELVQLKNRGRHRNFSVHRLVAIHFIENPNSKLEVNHIDGNKLNNHVCNLEWVTPKENMSHAYKIGLLPHLDKINQKYAR